MLIVRPVLLAAAALAVAPAAAQTPAPAARPLPVDPARLTAARPVAVKLWPLGTYKRMMSSTMDRMMDAMMASMFDMKLSDLAGLSGGDAAKTAETKEALGDATMGQVATAADPHFAERTKIATRVMFDEMGTLFARAEPAVQDAVAHGLARRFTTAELGEISAFFATPVGARYASDSMLLAVEPEMVSAMTKFVPDFMKAMPDIMKKVEKATAHLPPPPKPGTPDQDDDATPEEIKS
ncbi:hypothetical protein SAMN06297144_0317 [Sphingomonas guangdongensis]|uniref:DUF2059 domain-containing protein n=1 Tax=Sphingomonas guangdongensis TaxID=1141890 RepID=A0A285QFZ3_9SPHN|nr:DUF2059 domain-containing protein [Sphingomonas guangdongensis]SOB78992.1 hypothetical protein SAMN06297144_0317 [Sphingomonas guangdongensis]